MSFLDFSDIQDFTQVEPHEFIEFTNSKPRSLKMICTKEKVKCIAKRKRNINSSEEVLSQEIPSPTLRHDETHVSEEFRKPILKTITRNNT